jgi:hypothetical protein
LKNLARRPLPSSCVERIEHQTQSPTLLLKRQLTLWTFTILNWKYSMFVCSLLYRYVNLFVCVFLFCFCFDIYPRPWLRTTFDWCLIDMYSIRTTSDYKGMIIETLFIIISLWFDISHMLFVIWLIDAPIIDVIN